MSFTGHSWNESHVSGEEEDDEDEDDLGDEKL